MVRKCRKAKGMVEAGIGVSSTYMQLRSADIRSETSSSVADNNGVSSSNLSSCNRFIVDLEKERDGDTETSTYRRNTKRKLFENLRDKEYSSKSMENSAAGFVSGFVERFVE